MIILIEGEYPRGSRNTSTKMQSLILEEFEIHVSEREILKEFGLIEDYEMESKKIENGYN